MMPVSLRSFVIALAAAFAVVLVPTGASAASAAKAVICKDATTSEGGRGACSGHGGIDKAATAKAQADAKAEEKAKKEKEKAEAKAEKEKAKAEKEKAKAEKTESKAEEAAGGQVICKDGSTSKGGRGACRGHGGVDKGATAKAAASGAAAPAAASAQAASPAAPVPQAAPTAPSAPAPAGEKADAAKGPPTARCKDGTLSYAKHHSGACSRHGGVAEWLDKK